MRLFSIIRSLRPKIEILVLRLSTEFGLYLVGGFWFSCVAGANLNLLLPMRWFMTGAVLLVWWVLFLRYGSLLVLAIDGWIITILYFKARLTKSLPEMLRLIKLSRHGPTATLLLQSRYLGGRVSTCRVRLDFVVPGVICLVCAHHDSLWLESCSDAAVRAVLVLLAGRCNMDSRTHSYELLSTSCREFIPPRSLERAQSIEHRGRYFSYPGRQPMAVSGGGPC